jgi:hypothetical protein
MTPAAATPIAIQAPVDMAFIIAQASGDHKRMRVGECESSGQPHTHRFAPFDHSSCTT